MHLVSWRPPRAIYERKPTKNPSRISVGDEPLPIPSLHSSLHDFWKQNLKI